MATWAVLAAVSMLAVSCGGAMGLEVAPELHSNRYDRIGLLVLRVGTNHPYGSPRAIDLSTDFAASTLGLSNDIIIEDESRLRLMPSYPRFADYPGISYFDNITSTITQTVTEALEAKGHQVIEARLEGPGSGTSDASETVRALLERNAETCDALLVLLYVDIGAVTAQSMPGAGGFNGIFYRLTLFDTRTGQELLRYAVQHNHFSMIESYANDGTLRDKVRVEPEGDGGIDSIQHDLTDEERVRAAMRYLRFGLEKKRRLVGRQTSAWRGLEEILPQAKIKQQR